jgi:daunorubicin/doxorubicin transport system ATP-binding protein
MAMTASPTVGKLAVEAVGLRKAFAGSAALDGLDLAIPRGTIYGVLGPNGAGKTTTIRILATLLRPDSGSASVLGYDVVREPAKVRRRISLTAQFASVDEDLTAFENLALLGRLLGHPRKAARARAHELLAAFDLADAAGRQVMHMSGGMRRRLDVAASIIATPELLFLDEPTTGLDPRSRGDVWDVVRAITAYGTTVLLTTQYLDEADRLADRIAVVDHGRVIAEGTRGELKASVGAGGIRVRLVDPAQREAAERVLAADLGVAVQAGREPAALAVRITARERPGEAAERAAHALAELARAGIGVSDFALGQPSLDEVFLALTGSRAAPDADETVVGTEVIG